MTTVLLISIIFQLIAVFFAFKLTQLTKQYFAWVLIGSAISLMAVRRIISFLELINQTSVIVANPIAEYVALIISGLLAVGIISIEPLFKSIKKNELELGLKNHRLEDKNIQIKQINEELLIAKEKVQESKNYLDNIINGIGDPVFVKDNQSKFVLVNDAFCTIFNLSRAKIIGKTLVEEVTPEEQEGFLKIDKQVLSNGEESILEESLTVRDAKPKIISTRKTSIIDKHSNKNLIGIIRDISDLKTVEDKLIAAKEKAEESESKFRELFEKSGDAIVINKNGVIAEFNQAMVKLFGYHSKDEFIGVHPSQISPEFQPDGKSSFEKAEEVLNLAAKNETHRFEWMHKKSNGKDFLCEILVTLIIDEPDNRIFHGVIREITSYKNTEEELIIAKEKAEESDRLKTEFINNMSHEIRTPMNGILGFSEMLNDNDISDEKRVNFIKIIQSSGKQLLNVIDDIIDISRLGTKQVKVIETDVCLNDVMLELFSTFDIKAKEQNNPLYLKKALSDKQSTIRTDITKLNKVLSNLLENALKFTNEGFIEFGYQLKNNDLVLYVKDTGIGIEKSKHESIFERFSQAEKDLSKNVGGLGLGLSIAKENAELLGGGIQLESEEGKGSTFFVIIPYNPVYKVNDIEKIKMEPRYTILIAEDEEINYLYLELLLKDTIGLDCKIIHVKNGEDSIVACKENKTIDLVLMDLKMPILNGFEATKLIKKLRPSLPIVAQTAYSTLEDKERAILVGCDDFISKPIHQESFKKILDKYLIIK